MRLGRHRLGGSNLLFAIPVLIATAIAASFAVGNPPQQGGGVYPVPGMGPPGAVAAYGAIVPRPVQAPVAPLPQPAPLVAARFLAPQGVRVTAFPGSELARVYDAPATMGLRPGYVYRFELTNLPYSPGKSLYPEVEVRGSIVPRPGMKYMEYPIPLVFTQADIERALLGALVTKVIYLEDPEKAIAVEVQPDKPVETPENSELEAIKAARENGRLMAIVRLGDRKPSPQELLAVAIDGTILLPGDNRLRAPAIPPVIPFYACPFYDPIGGSKGPKEECFVNGEDKYDTLGIDVNQRLGGLNPTDVGVEFSMGGKRRVTTSTVICICSPRYMIRRAELVPSGVDARVRMAANVGQLGPAGMRERQAPMADIGRDKANEFNSRLRATAYIGRVGTSFWVGTSKPIAIGQIQGVRVEGALVEPEQMTAYPSLCPLTVTKSVEPQGPRKPGDIVTITIRYANTGAKEITDLVVSDSLSGRLEYIAGSAETDRPGNFAAAENEVGSVVLRWDLPGSLLPGQTGSVRFKARVR